MIINCPNCGKEISSTSKTCVHCGYRLVKKSKMKWLLFVIGGVALLGAVLFFLLHKNGLQVDNNSISKEFSEMVNQYDYVSSCFPFNNETYVICVGKEGKYGLLSTDGELVVPCEYDSVIYAVSDSAYAFCIKKNGKFGLMNNKGEVVLPCEYDSKITLRTEAYNKCLAVIQKNNQIGIVNLKNFSIVVPCEYKSTYGYGNIQLVFRDENLLWLLKNERYALIDGNGNKLTDFIYSDVFDVSRYDVCPVCKNGEWGFINKEGKEIPSSFGIGSIGYSSTEEAAFERYPDYFDNYGKRISESELFDGVKTVFSVVGSRYGNTGGKYDQGNKFYGGFAIVTKFDFNEDKNYYGLINEQGEEVIPLTSDGCLYEDLLEDGYVLNLNDDNHQMGVLDTKGNTIIPCEYQMIIFLGQGLFIVEENETYGLFQANKGFVSDVRYNSISTTFGFDLTDGTTGSSFKYIPQKRIDNTNNELIAVESLSGMWGIVDIKGNPITECVYDELRYSPYPIVLVMKGDRWGLISLTGQEIAPCEYYEMYDFSCGLARVKKGERYGFVDMQGNSTFSK